MTLEYILKTFVVNQRECGLYLHHQMHRCRSGSFCLQAIQHLSDRDKIEIGSWQSRGPTLIPRAFADCNKRKTRAGHQAFLRRCNCDVDIPIIELKWSTAQGTDHVDHY